MNFCQVTESQAANPISSEGVCAFVFVFGSISRCPAGQGRPPATVPPHTPRRISGTATRVKGLSKTYNHHQGCNEVQHTDFGVVVWAGTRAQGQSEACLEAKLTGILPLLPNTVAKGSLSHLRSGCLAWAQLAVIRH